MFVLTKDRIIKNANHYGIALLNKNEENIFNNVFGNVLDCMHTNDGNFQCGHTLHCASCKLKESCEKIYNRKETYITNVFERKGIKKDGQIYDKTFLYSAKRIYYEGHEMILLIVDDITKTEEQKRLIEEQKQHIESSLRYAINIQSALLPSKEILNLLLKEHFLLYEPKDYIGGDFYWVYERDNKTFLTVGDCTGHGVPGAMLTVLGITSLNEIIKSQGNEKPAVILNQLRKQVISVLNNGTEHQLTDGMDLALCVIDKSKNQIHFAGSNSKICLIQENTTIEIKGDNMPIGIFDNMKEFSQQTFPYKKDDMLYLYTDGFKDQFGGKDDKKIGRKRFNSLLKKNKQHSATKQKVQLMNFYNRWKSDKEQTDDMTILGIRL